MFEVTYSSCIIALVTTAVTSLGAHARIIFNNSIIANFVVFLYVVYSYCSCVVVCVFNCVVFYSLDLYVCFSVLW